MGGYYAQRCYLSVKIIIYYHIVIFLKDAAKCRNSANGGALEGEYVYLDCEV